MKRRDEILDLIIGFVIMFILAAVIGWGFGRWADSLPPSPEERAGLVEGPKHGR